MFVRASKLDEIKFSSAEVDSLIELFSVDTESVRPVVVNGLTGGTTVFEVDWAGESKVFLIDSFAGKEFACHPSVVGTKLDRLAFEAAKDAANFMAKSLHAVDTDNTVFLNVLRAAPGYKLYEGFEYLGINLRQLWIRPRYVLPSYRDHEDTTKTIEVVYENFEALPSNRKLCLIKPDTEATGKTSEVALKRAFEAAEAKNSEIKHLIIYGFVSKPGLEYLEKILHPYGPKISVLAIENLTALCFNKYDMPMFGVDESFHSEFGEIKKVSGTASRETFRRFLPEFIPGVDEPGDWSARQTRVFTGLAYEDGGISKHARNSMRFLERLRALLEKLPEMEQFLDRYKLLITNELRSLRELAGKDDLL